jgi:hypothetical protein
MRAANNAKRSRKRSLRAAVADSDGAGSPGRCSSTRRALRCRFRLNVEPGR